MPQFLSGQNKQSACVACVLCHLVAETGSASSHDALHLSTCCRFFTHITTVLLWMQQQASVSWFNLIALKKKAFLHLFDL